MGPDIRDGAWLGGLLRCFRRAAGLTQRELAGRAGLSLGSVRDLEQGRTRRPERGTLVALAAALGLNGVQAGELERAAAGPGLWVQVLGPLAVWRNGAAVPLGGPAQRAVLGLLALSAGSLVHRASIIDALWPDDPPASAVKLIQAHVSRIRKALASGDPRGREALLSSAGASYRLRAGPAQLDLLRFSQLAADARAARACGGYAAACDLYEQAMGLWRGDVLADADLLRGHLAVAGVARQWATVVVEYAQVASAAGWHGRVLPLLQELAGHEPLNEQAHAQMMIALAGSGHQAEALAVYQDLCRRLDDELGMTAGPDLAKAYQLVLRQEIPAIRASASLTGPPPGGGALPRVVPRQIPAQTRLFAGRAGELKALSALLDGAGDAGPAVVICAVGGTAGVGKTALAVHWAHQAADRFPDGQLYADLRGWGPSADRASPADLITRFLDALGVPADQLPAAADARQDLYRSLLAGRRMLIVLDNAGDATQVRPLLPGGSSCVVLVTSRSRLASLVAAEAAYPLSLDVLTAAEARELLILRLGPERVAAEPDAADELAELCARLPLALAIAASRAALHPAMSLAMLADGLRDAGGRLTALDAGENVSVEAAFSWSYRHLPAPARRMFRLLGMHPGPDISAAAAASLAGTGPGQARAMLRQLAEASLLTEYVPGRFQFHDLLRVYAAGCASAVESQQSQRDAVHRALDHYLHSGYAANQMLRTCPAAIPLSSPQPGVVPEPSGDFRQAMAWLGAEQHVLAALVDHAASTGFDTHCWHLAVTLASFLDHKGNTASSLSILRAALAAAQRLGDRQAQTRVHCSTGGALIYLGAYDDAERHYRQALALCQQAGDRAGQALAHLGLGKTAGCQGRYHDALTHTWCTLALSQPAHHPGVRAAALNDLGWHHACLGEYEQALDYCPQAISLHQELGDCYHEAHAWDSLGYAQSHLGQHSKAVSSYHQALALFRQVYTRADEAISLGNLGDAYRAASQPHLAVQAWQQAHAILDELHHRKAQEIRSKLQRANRPEIPTLL